MRLLITSFVILFGLLSPSFGEEIKDVGLICKGKSDVYLVIWLMGEKRLESYERDEKDINNDGDTIEFFLNHNSSEKMRHHSTDTEITITFLTDRGVIDFSKEIRINRFDLSVEQTSSYIYKTYKKCEVFNEKETFQNSLRKIENDIKKFLSKRKI